MSLTDIGDILSREEHAISRWVKERCQYRLASIFDSNHGNENSSKLTREQRLEIKTALEQSPSAYGLPEAFWDVPALKPYIAARFELSTGLIGETSREEQCERVNA